MLPDLLRRSMFGLLVCHAATQCLAGEAGALIKPVSPEDAVRRMTVPDGFRVTVFAAEPDVVQPIAMTTDEHGRLWVVECFSYPNWQKQDEGKDRVIILEDRDGDGRFDARKVFFDKGRNLAGIAIGFGGVYLCSAPELIFISDRNRDDIPDGPPEVLLDGWSLEAKHNIVNGLTWGPDGWLYGCHGILSDSKVGKPGASDAERITINCGVWRFHPTTHLFEVVAHGTTNPWGIAFDAYGQMFVANCVIKHLFHIIPGARYERMYGQDLNPYAFRLIESCADHIHWAGGYWPTEGRESPLNDAAGGGHAHCGAMVYLGDNWPERYRNGFFTLNVHGRRINHDLLERRGSGYVANHLPDVVRVNDPWFRGVSLIYGPDGGVFMSDWSDAGECHDYEDIHRENGRIYKITYGPVQLAPIDLAQLPDMELVKLQLHKNDWFVSQARRLLQERAIAGRLSKEARPALIRLLREQQDATRRLRALWALHAIDGLDHMLALELLNHREERLRAWTIQLALEGRKASAPLLTKLTTLATEDSSPIVRLNLASGLQRLSLMDRLPIAEALVARAEDESDANVPLIIWYGIEPIISGHDPGVETLLYKARIPLLRQFIAQRLALRQPSNTSISLLVHRNDPGLQRDIVRGMFEALNGRREVPVAIDSWRRAAAKLADHPDAEIREKALLLSLIFGDANAATTLRQRALNPAEPAAARQQALQALVQARANGLVTILQSLVNDAPLRRVAIRGLAAFDDPSTPNAILDRYARLTPEEKTEAINTLASRPDYAVALLDALKQGKLSLKDISPFAARQIHALKDPRVKSLATEVLGEVRSISKDKAVQIARYKELLTPAALQTANPSRGRAVYNRACAACHTLFGEGGTVAPELTGSQRGNIDYLLENVVDPNAIAWNRYRATYFETADGRLISGIVLRENESTVTIQTQTGTVTLPQSEITSRQESTLSMMPEGLFEALTLQDILDLVAYLRSPAQVALSPGNSAERR